MCRVEYPHDTVVWYFLIDAQDKQVDIVPLKSVALFEFRSHFSKQLPNLSQKPKTLASKLQKSRIYHNSGMVRSCLFC